MANKKFTDLASKATAAAADIIAITDSSDNTSKRTTVGGLVTAILAAIVGAVTPSHWTNPYVFRAYRTASLSSPSGGQAKITFDTESFDDNNNFSGGTYTVPVDGKYQINARFSIATSTAVAFILIYKNGAEFARGGLGKANSEYIGVTFADLLEFEAGDTVEVYAFTSASLAYELGSKNTYFSGHLVSKS